MKQEVCNLFLNLVTTVLRRSGWLLAEVIPDVFPQICCSGWLFLLIVLVCSRC